MAKKFEDVYGIISSNGKREITLEKICNIIDIPVPEHLIDIKDIVQEHAATKLEYARTGCFYFRISNVGDKNKPIKKWLKYIRKKNCTAIFVDKGQYYEEGLRDIDLPLVPVDNIVEKTGKFFAYIKDLNGVQTYAVTGTCGKTTTMKFLGNVVSQHYKTWMNDGNANSFQTVSKHIIENLEPKYEVYIQETGASTLGAIEKSAAMLEVDAFILLNVFNHHINEYKTQEALLKDKASFDRYMKEDGVAVVNYDDEKIAAYEFKHKVITFGINTDRKVDYRAKNIVQNGEFLELDIEYEGKTDHMTISILGEQNAYNALAAFALCRHMGIKSADIIKGLANYKSTGYRQRFWYLGGYNLLIDAYNVCEDSLKANIKTIKDMKTEPGKKKIAVITGENKLGEKAEEISFDLGRNLDLEFLDHVIVVGPAVENEENINYYCHGRALYEGIVASGYKNAVYVTNPADMETEIRKVISEGDLILFKGMYNLDLTPVIDKIFGSKIAIQNPYYIKQAEKVENEKYTALKFPVLDSLELTESKNRFAKQITIPDAIDGSPVHSLAKGLHAFNARLKKLDLGKTLKNIGKGAFAGCIALRKVTVPSNVLVIDKGAFQYCIGLREVVIEEGVTHIEEDAFKGCIMLSKVTIPESVKYIAENAFDKCIFVDKKYKKQ